MIRLSPIKGPSYNIESIYDLLLAEIAGQRGRWDISLVNYIRQARATRDPQVIERAALIAGYMRAHHAASELAILWAEAEPDNPQAQILAAEQLLRSSRMNEALEHVDRALLANPAYPLDDFIQTSRILSSQQRNKLSAELQIRAEEAQKNQNLWFAVAQLHEQNGDFEAAEKACRQVLRTDRKHLEAKMLLGHLMLQQQHPIEQVTRYYGKVSRQHSDSKRAGITYARLLAQSEKKRAAQKQYRKLAARFIDDKDLIMSVALIAMENDMPSDARYYLEKSIYNGHRADEAYTYLGQMYASDEKFEQAISSFESVSTGPHYLGARLQIAQLHSQSGDIEAGLEEIKSIRAQLPSDIEQLYMLESDILIKAARLHEAMLALNDGLMIFKNSSNLLYSRAMLADRMGNTDKTESDLRIILENNPNNPVALNALGYTLADKTDRYEEALQYISQAIALQPDDPAVIDSMGWVQYKLGNIDLALEYLQRAYDMFPDHEVSAHLGEVLWVKGRKTRAREIWNRGLQDHPDSQLLKHVVSQFTQ